MITTFDVPDLVDRGEALVAAAKAAGATDADCAVIAAQALSATVREGKLEESESAETLDIGLRVFVGRRSAIVSGTPADAPALLAERAVAMAKAAPEDPYAGLAEPERLGRTGADLDLDDASRPGMERLVEAARAADDAMCSVPGVTRSGGSSAEATHSAFALVTSTGFADGYRRSRFSVSATAVAGDGTQMERDYWFDVNRRHDRLEAPEVIGRTAAERAVRRLNPRRVKTRTGTVVFEPRAATGFVRHFLSAVNGAAVARKTSFLQTRMGEEVFAPSVRIVDAPLRPEGLASRPFDGEGLAGTPIALVENGVLGAWLLDCAAARELGLEPNGRAARGLGGPGPSATNVRIDGDGLPARDILASVKSGLYVTDLIGQGVNIVTGDYSRGAAGYWIENGELAYPVSEITIAGRLQDMFRRARFGDDHMSMFSVEAPTVAVEDLTIGGA